MQRLFNRALRPLGYKLVPLTGSFQLYPFQKPDGSLDYDRYKATQIRGNKKKIDTIWVEEGNIDFLASDIRRHMTPTFGLCHGTRRGVEQKWFSDRLGCEVLGTEISDTATDFPNTIQWDFHDVKPEWLGAVDFIYTNSLDHSYDPALALERWTSCLKPGGRCYVEHTSEDGPHWSRELDPFGADLPAMPYLIAEWAKGRYGLVEILHPPRGAKYRAAYLVLERRPEFVGKSA